MKIKKIGSKGFTLLELLVVISIIGILMAMGAVAYSTAQQKGRDSRRHADMQAIQDAQEQYYATTGGYAGTQDLLQSAGYLQTILDDPHPSKNYTLTTDGLTPKTKYCACADVDDNKGNANSAGSGGICSWNNTSTGSYTCVGNLQ